MGMRKRPWFCTAGSIDEPLLEGDFVIDDGQVCQVSENSSPRTRGGPTIAVLRVLHDATPEQRARAEKHRDDHWRRFQGGRW